MPANERLATLDEFGTRQRVIPAEVKGPLRRRRDWTYAFLLIIMLVLPWVKINGMQAVWLNLPERRFEIFGFLFLSHDAPLVFFVAMFLVLVLALVTALWGRVWCGWACPQTVFIDFVYRRIEIWVEGNYIERRKLAAGPWSLRKIWLWSLKWFLFLVVSSIIAHSAMAYFAGAKPLLAMMQGPPAENWRYFVTVTFITLLLLFNFGWFREQFCLIMCPYGRFQSVLMDQRSVAVMYDEKRGEPRKGSLLDTAASATRAGDCVRCNRCVQVCPTGIDIRNGLQMECISCTACIDACNLIMAKVNKPPGLIRHKKISENENQGPRIRVWAYSSLAFILILALSVLLARRQSFSMLVIRATDTPYQMIQDDRILNHFKAHYMNQSIESQEVEFVLSKSDLDRGFSLTQSQPRHSLEPGQAVEPHFFVSFPRKILNPKGEAGFQILVRNLKNNTEKTIDVGAVGPYSAGSSSPVTNP